MTLADVLAPAEKSCQRTFKNAKFRVNSSARDISLWCLDEYVAGKHWWLGLSSETARSSFLHFQVPTASSALRCAGRDVWRRKVRVARILPVYGFLRADQISSVEMVSTRVPTFKVCTPKFEVLKVKMKKGLELLQEFNCFGCKILGIPFVHLSPSIYMFHDIHRNDADLPSPFLWGKKVEVGLMYMESICCFSKISFEAEENDEEGYHQLKISMEK
ncbi:hypothetical protein QL285_035100 [Trifolium repens]|nr:hypothetical protein QL285_035100 [Trifolium repens]